MSQVFDVLIVGGGIVGLSAALAMAKRNYTVAVIDAGVFQVNTALPDLRVYAINKASQTLLTELGAWPNLDIARMAPYTKMQVWDGKSNASIEFDSRAIAAPTLGTIIEESVLKEALLQQILADPTIYLFPHCFIDQVQQIDQGIKISSQTLAWEGRILLIAEGANSPTRQKLKVELSTWPYNQQALVATVNTEKPHLFTAYQVFHVDGPLAFLPLSNPNQCSIVWSTNPKQVERLKALDEKEFNLELTQKFAGRLGKVTLISTRQSFPLQMRHVKQYVGEHWLLLGDAAHTIHPLAGLGLNTGLADLSTWLRCLDASKGNLTSRKVLGAYQRERKAAVWQIIWLMESLKGLFTYSFTPIVSLRALGFGLCNKSRFLKRLLIQYASGG